MISSRLRVCSRYLSECYIMAPSPSRWFRIGAVVFGLSLLPLIECGLRMSGVVDGPAPTLPAGSWSAGDRHRPALVEKDGMVRPAEDQVRGGFMHDLSFPVRPTPGVPRVVCLGGSATLGVPVESTPERTFPGRLEARLASAGFPAEVINLGGASFGSDQVRALVEAVLPYQPDALVIYSGNNEFFNYNLRLYEANRQWHAERLAGLHLMRVLQQAISRPPSVDAQRESQEAVVAAAIAAQLDTEEGWPRDTQRRDSIHAAVVERYRTNLSAVASLTAGAEIPVLIARVPANLAEPPWLALAAPGENGGAAEAALAGDCASAASAIEQAPSHAGGWYRRGMCARQEGAPSQQWAPDLEAALRLDLSPGRPPPALQSVPASLAAEWKHVDELPLNAIFSHSARPEFGLDLFHDSCHLTPDGYDRLASEIAIALARRW